MPEKPLTIAAYAAGASLAAVTLVYVFGPTFFLDDEAAHSSRASRKRGIVGLHNPANDCFINSVLQALAGLPELRLYLIREMHRRKLDGPELYTDLTAALEEQRRRQRAGTGKPLAEWNLLGLQQGLVTAGLKEVLDALNERPIYKKTISAQSFIHVVEQAFRTRISRTQQDAQEFLQVIAERLDDEYYAGKRVRRKARRSASVIGQRDGSSDAAQITVDGAKSSLDQHGAGAPGSQPNVRGDSINGSGEPSEDADEDVDPFPFPFEGKMESQVECSYCQFRPQPAVSSFVSLTLHVPQVTSHTTLGACLDGMLKLEHIDDFTCDRCRLDHALQVNAREAARTDLSDSERVRLEEDNGKLRTALNTDPEKATPGVKLPDLSTAPKRRISRHTRISAFPRILAIHLSRSMWDAQASSKNLAKVSFPETMPIGGLLDRRNYRLLGVVTHKGGHNSGHYESFRRQFLSPPYSTPASMGTEGIYSLRASPAPSPHMSPALGASEPPSSEAHDLRNAGPTPPSSAAAERRRLTPANIPLEAIPTPGLPTPPSSASSAPRRSASMSSAMTLMRRKTGRGPERWWRISDEKVKECKTGEVLGMQKEVYLLFYEMIDDQAASAD